MPLILSFIISALVGGGAAYLLKHSRTQEHEQEVQKKIHTLIAETKTDAERIKKEAHSRSGEIKHLAQEENKRIEAHLKRAQEFVAFKEKQAQTLLDKNKIITDQVNGLKEEIKTARDEIQNGGQKMVDILLKKTNRTKEEAIQEAIQSTSNEILERKEKFIKNRLAEKEEDVGKLAKNLLLGAIQKYGEKSSVDHAETTVEVRAEQFKPAVIGEKGENIAYFEEKIDVEVIFNDYPKIITVGSYSVLKRHIAKEALEILQREKGPITFKKIDDALSRGEKTVEKMMQSQALKACQKMGLKNVPDEILAYLGKLYFRTSYGQNALNHSLEVGMFAGILASEIGGNVALARVAGFLHDIGKAISEESDKGHDILTKEILEKHGYPPEVVHAAWAHHEGEPLQSIEAKLIMAADALSASRPGARLESLERYLERIRGLEGVAASFDGVKKTFAISAGREVRVLVDPIKITDEMMMELAHGIATKIETELTYPGNVKVSLIRHRDWTSVAREKQTRSEA
ncbi:MAG: HD domain-containing protein [Candidatus Gracilibacteria bacterium]